jgi:hypothetical protein
MHTSPERANEGCINALFFLRSMYQRNGWFLIRNPPNLSEYEIQEYKWIAKGHYSRNEIIEGAVALGSLLFLLIGLAELFKRLNFEMNALLLIIIIAISTLPIFIWAIILIRRDKEKYRKINLLIKYWESQKERNLLVGDPTMELMRKTHMMMMRQIPYRGNMGYGR